MEQYAFALFDPHRFAAAQHSTVDREGIVPDLESMRRAFVEGSLHGVLSGILQILDRRRGRQKVHVHIAAAAERRLELLQSEKNLAIVAAGVLLRLDIDGTYQA